MYISKWVLALVIIFMACPTVHINAQQYDWEFDKIQKRSQEKAQGARLHFSAFKKQMGN